MMQKILGISDRILSFREVLGWLYGTMSLGLLLMKFSEVVGRRYTTHCAIGDLACLKPYFLLCGISFLCALFLILYMSKTLNAFPIVGNHLGYPREKMKYVIATIASTIFLWLSLVGLTSDFYVLNRSYGEGKLRYGVVQDFAESVLFLMCLLFSLLIFVNKMRLMQVKPNQKIV